ncbi:SapC family protein [Thalassotalea euphylliae]|uniref:SapC family protein n=1 Tax=Thalassotalea euphylliae TaxID=1655234 RepID=UPI00363B2292
MSAPVRPLNAIDHGKIKLPKTRHFPHVSDQQIVPLIVHEFSNASAEMPIVFVKNSETGEFQSVAVLGFEEGENLFVGEETWKGGYVPAVVTHYPLALMPSPENPEDMQVLLIEDDVIMNNQEGEAVFDEEGKETPFMENRKNAIGKYFENMHVTKAFTRFLAEKELLVEQTLNIQLGEQKRQLSGVYLVDERKLNALSDEDFIDMKKRGYLSPIYAHMLSVHQLNNLARMKAK